MKKHRKETHKEVQYTLTILPEFLIPHSYIRMHKVLAAIDYYVKTDNSSYSEAALIMNCINPLSFRRYYIRFLQKLYKWIMFIVKRILAVGGSIEQEKLTEPALNTRDKLVEYEKYTARYFKQYEKLPGSNLITDKPGYLHVLYSINGMDLGP